MALLLAARRTSTRAFSAFTHFTPPTEGMTVVSQPTIRMLATFTRHDASSSRPNDASRTKPTITFSRREFNSCYNHELQELRAMLYRIRTIYQSEITTASDASDADRHHAAKVAQEAVKEEMEHCKTNPQAALVLQPLRDISEEDFPEALSHIQRLGPSELARALHLNAENFVATDRITHHMATRHLLISQNQFEARRDIQVQLDQRKAAYEMAGLHATKEIWGENDYSIRGTIVLMPKGGHVKKVGEISEGVVPVFCSIYVIKNFDKIEPEVQAAVLKFTRHQPLSDAEKLSILMSRQIHPDIKAIFANDRNGTANHLAFDVKDIHLALDLTLSPLEQNRFQSGTTMDQRSTFVKPNGAGSTADYIEWVSQKEMPLQDATTLLRQQGPTHFERVLREQPELKDLPTDARVIIPGGFTPGNAQRMFSSTLPGVFKTIFDLHEQAGHPLSSDQKVALFKENLDMIEGIKDNPEEMEWYLTALKWQFGVLP